MIGWIREAYWRWRQRRALRRPVRRDLGFESWKARVDARELCMLAENSRIRLNQVADDLRQAGTILVPPSGPEATQLATEFPFSAYEIYDAFQPERSGRQDD